MGSDGAGVVELGSSLVRKAFPQHPYLGFRSISVILLARFDF